LYVLAYAAIPVTGDVESAMAQEAIQGTQQALMRTLLHNKPGETVDGLARKLGVSRNAVRQHLTALERDGLVAKGARQPSGGRPEQLYVLTPEGHEQFPRQYSWMSEILLQALEKHADGDLGDELERMGEAVGKSLQAQIGDAADSQTRIAALAGLMAGLGYDARVAADENGPVIEAKNCVFHKLAFKRPDVCRFDLAMMGASTGTTVEHRKCMARGADCCAFAFRQKAQI
jgi:predicted ArsR family transcriptional regulator